MRRMYATARRVMSSQWESSFIICKLSKYGRLLRKTVFGGNNAKQVIKNNKQCNIDYTFSKFDQLNDDIKDLLAKMLQKDSKERITAEEALNHHFFKNIK
eukprot:GHVR01185383.1.p1 GENE.GHVR01185383.1~~GHVR01185383.1.p1  ORF type:complete len:100 (+),score=10.34 GHVR01185383.1:129-428(+)